MVTSKEDFLERYEEFFRRYKTQHFVFSDTHNEFMNLLSLGFLKLGYNEMMSIKPKMDEIKEKYFESEE